MQFFKKVLEDMSYQNKELNQEWRKGSKKEGRGKEKQWCVQDLEITINLH